MSLVSKFDSILSKARPTNAFLKNLVRLCGVPQPQNSTKQALISSLKLFAVAPPSISPVVTKTAADVKNDYGSQRVKSNKHSIVSIDVGLKNFSLSRFSVGSTPDTGLPGVPSLLQWFKVNLPHYAGYNECPQLDPQIYSKMIDQALMDLVLMQNVSNNISNPDIIIIERQRFRSDGGRIVQESVIKSNIVEFMLFSALQTLHMVQPSFNPLIVSSSPRTMSLYWENYFLDRITEAERVGVDVKDTKALRMILVDDWLQCAFGSTISGKTKRDALYPPFVFSSELTKGFQMIGSDGISKRFKRFKSVSRRIYESMKLLNEVNIPRYRLDLEDGGVKKGDDVTDSLLHGLVYLTFERNKELLRRNIRQGLLSVSDVN